MSSAYRCDECGGLHAHLAPKTVGVSFGKTGSLTFTVPDIDAPNKPCGPAELCPQCLAKRFREAAEVLDAR